MVRIHGNLKPNMGLFSWVFLEIVMETLVQHWSLLWTSRWPLGRDRYQTGVTTREISDIIERIYGHHYNPTTISNISKATQENVVTFHERSLEANYSVLFLDGAYLPLRRVTVSKECIHIALDITPEGQKAVLGYEIAPNENNASWTKLLDKLQNQRIQRVSLVVTDGFKVLEQIISQVYPLAK